MYDHRDPAQAELIDHVAPEEGMRRRDFLRRTAYTAGLAGLASGLPAETLIAEAAKKQRRLMLPSPSNMPIDTIVVLMMENRSFDHYLGWMPNADGMQAGLSYVDTQGVSHDTHRLSPDWQGCGHPDPDHSWDGGRGPMNGGALGRVPENRKDEVAVGDYGGGGPRVHPEAGEGVPEDRQRRVRDRLLRRGRPRVHPGRGEGVHDIRSLPLLADGRDAAQPRVHACGAVLWPA